MTWYNTQSGVVLLARRFTYHNFFCMLKTDPLLWKDVFWQITLSNFDDCLSNFDKCLTIPHGCRASTISSYTRVFPTGWYGGSPLTSGEPLPPPHQAKICSPPPLQLEKSLPPPSTHTPPNQIFISSPPKINPPTKKIFLNYNPIKTSFLAVVIAPVPFMFLISYSFDTQVMLILILIEVQYSQNAVLSFEKSSNHQNHSSGSHQPLPPPPQAKFLIPAPLPLGGFTPTTTSYCYLENPGYK